ncbi:MAG: alpha/beta hydrolase [Verrucomicrobiota bacterium]
MARRKKRFKKRWIALGLFLVLGGCAVKTIMEMPMEEMQQMAEDARNFTAEVEDGFATNDGIHTAAHGNPDAPVALYFVHGSPGDWTAFSSYLMNEDLKTNYLMFSPDRPGYGATDPGVTDGSFASQARRLAPLAQDVDARKIWIGHSFGVPIIAKVAADQPDLVDGLIFIGGAMSVEFERKKWYHSLGNTRLARAVLSDSWRVANEEAIAFEDEFVNLEADWETITCPVTIIHATNDSLADYRHVDFAVEQITNAPVEVVKLEKGDHFVLWSDPQIVIEAIDAMATQLTN